MVRFYFSVLLFLSTTAQARQAESYDTSLINSRSKLIGWTRIENYRDNMSFILDQPEPIKQLIPALTAGKEVNRKLSNQTYFITLIQDNIEVKAWKVNFESNRVMINGQSYWFDASLIRKLARENPFRFKTERKVFRTSPEAQAYLRKQSLNRDFLFAEIPPVIFEGRFDVPVPRNAAFTHPDSAASYLRSRIESITPRGTYDFYDFHRSLSPDDKIRYTITICGSRELFDKVDLGDLEKEKWKSFREASIFYYRKY